MAQLDEAQLYLFFSDTHGILEKRLMHLQH
jgi:hypothetical protein